MVRFVRPCMAAALLAALVPAPAATAQTSGPLQLGPLDTGPLQRSPQKTKPQLTALKKRAKHPAPEGRQITVHPRPSYLTAGTQVPVGSYNGYVYGTFNQSPPIEGTFTGLHGRERIQDQFANPGPGLTLFRF